MSPDPAGMAAVDPTNPQSWNRYTYVLNNPLALIDPLGEQCFYYLVWDDGWHQVSADGFCGPSGGGGGPPSDGGGNSAGGGGKLQQPKNPCVAGALKAGATNVGIDLLGFLPEAGGVARVVGHQAGYVGNVADNLGKNMLNAGTKTTGTLASAIGFSSSDWTTWVSAGITAADFVPVLSDFTTFVAIAWDAGVAAYKVYQCPK
jgi:hypothetical protein